MKIEVKNLKRYFVTAKAVDDVSFSFSSGQIVGFVGPNGAGKTTTLRIMATLDEPTDGDVLLDNISILDYPDKARAVIGYVPDNLPVQKNISVEEYLDFFARAYNIPDPRRTALVTQLEEFTNLSGIRDKLLPELSKGMKQRVNLARALLNDPQLLLLDEPAAGLDPRARVELRELLKILSAKGKAILISSHILSELSEMCNAAVIIEQGRLLKAGMLDEILETNLPVRSMSVRSTDKPEELLKKLLLMPDVQSAHLEGRDIILTIEGDDSTCARLLSNLVSQGFNICEFKQRKSDLESVFMNITKGEVQ